MQWNKHPPRTVPTRLASEPDLSASRFNYGFPQSANTSDLKPRSISEVDGDHEAKRNLKGIDFVKGNVERSKCLNFAFTKPHRESPHSKNESRAKTQTTFKMTLSSINNAHKMSLKTMLEGFPLSYSHLGLYL